MTIGVLFVCTGNICRSPMAKGVFTTLVRRAGLAAAFTIDSAGTYEGHVGRPASPLAITAARRRGYDIADPYGGPAAGYEKALDLIEAGCKGLLTRLAAQVKAAT